MRGNADTQVLAGLVSGAYLMSAAASRGDATATDVLRALCTALGRALDVDGVGVLLADGRTLRFVDADPGWVVEVNSSKEPTGGVRARTAFVSSGSC